MRPASGKVVKAGGWGDVDFERDSLTLTQRSGGDWVEVGLTWEIFSEAAWDS